MNAQTKVCPFCAETIKSAAVICRYCSSNLSTGVAANGKGQAAAVPSQAHRMVDGKCKNCGCSKAFIQKFSPSCDGGSPSVKEITGIQKSGPKCPKCKSGSIAAGKSGFGLGKALVGGVALGGFGLLAGFVGSKKVLVSCLNCGHNWKPSSR